MSPSQSQLGAFLARSRKAAGLSQERLGALAGLPGSTIQRYETGFIEQPDPYKLASIAEALGIEVEDLYAAAGLTPASGLPSFETYLRTKFGDDLSEEARAELESHFRRLTRKEDP